MLFRVRGKDPSGDWFGGTVDKQGERFSLAAGDFTMEPIRFWKSQRSLALYPVDWKIRIPAHSIDLVITTIRDDQELTNAAPPPPLLSEERSTDRGREEVPTYWEGAVLSTDRSAIGYLELTGYDKPIGKVL
jgi:predicted secreted hydrolase